MPFPQSRGLLGKGPWLWLLALRVTDHALIRDVCHAFGLVDLLHATLAVAGLARIDGCIAARMAQGTVAVCAVVILGERMFPTYPAAFQPAAGL
ncbi:MAG: hypothetical protein E3J21_18555 [Anaerolineales bacterium]|nr:MAG: hypothetical protein E3J21_18555 [Anaerolineales bacterium]